MTWLLPDVSLPAGSLRTVRIVSRGEKLCINELDDATKKRQHAWRRAYYRRNLKSQRKKARERYAANRERYRAESKARQAINRAQNIAAGLTARGTPRK